MQNPSHNHNQKINVETAVLFWVVFYLGCIILAEILTFYADLMVGVIACALVIFFCVNHSARRHKNELFSILPVIALLPFMRLLSVVVPVSGWPSQTWYALITSPVLASIGLIAYTRRISLSSLGLLQSPFRSQFLIALTGIPLGLIGFFILRPAPLFQTSTALMMVANLLIVLVFIAFVEEIVFRGILLHSLVKINDQFGVLATALVYGAFHFGSNSLLYVIFMMLVGWLFARFVTQTRSIWGVIFGHFFLTVGMGLLWPNLF